MKKIIYTIFILFIGIGCEDINNHIINTNTNENDTLQGISNEPIKLVNVIYGGCNDQLSEKKKTIDEINTDTVYYSYDSTKLNFFVGINYICCAPFKTDYSILGDSLIIFINDTCDFPVNSCYCRCDCYYTFNFLFDITGNDDLYYEVIINDPRQNEPVVFKTGIIQTDIGNVPVTAKVIYNSECKNLKSAKENDSDTLNCIIYDFNEGNNTLLLKHLNTQFNCCIDSIFCNVYENHDTIIIHEQEAGPQCWCICSYDIDIKLTGILPKKYYLKLIEVYTEEYNNINYLMDLANSSEGKYCIIRNQ